MACSRRWKIKETGRTVNQTCVDGKIIDVVEKIRPECFAKCPQPTNSSSACYLHCFFDTMVGNDQAKPPVPAMDPQAIVAPFVAAFDDESKGGCASV